MNRPTFSAVSVIASLLASLAVGCAATSDGAEGLEATASELSEASGAVYTMTNAADANAVVVFQRAANGSLRQVATYPTGGKGSGDGLGSQGAVTLSADRKWLYAVNAGSDEVSVFSVRGATLRLIDRVASYGARPVSVTAHAGLVYVLNSAGIAGFAQRSDGTLSMLPGSIRALSVDAAGPAQVSFSPSGRALVVTEKATNKIDEFRIDRFTGLPGELVVHDSNGMTPFGFAITSRGQVIVSEAFGGAVDASAVSSYQLGTSAGLTTVTGSLPNTEGAACWVALAKGDHFAYVTNTLSGTVSAYTVGDDGRLALVDADGRAADTEMGSKPTDVATSRDDRFLYVVASGTASMSVIRIEHDGSLRVLSTVTGLAPTLTGLAAQ